MVLGRDTNNKREDTSNRGGEKRRHAHGNDEEEVDGVRLAMSNLEIRLKSHKTEPQSKEKALASIEKLKEDIGMKGIRSNREEIEKILERAGSLADELINLKKEEEAKRAL